MKALSLCVIAATLLAGFMSLPATAQNPHDPHPTVTAVHKMGQRKVAHVAKVTHHTKQHFHNWKQRKGHNARAWINKH